MYPSPSNTDPFTNTFSSIKKPTVQKPIQESYSPSIFSTEKVQTKYSESSDLNIIDHLQIFIENNNMLILVLLTIFCYILYQRS